MSATSTPRARFVRVSIPLPSIAPSPSSDRHISQLALPPSTSPSSTRQMVNPTGNPLVIRNLSRHLSPPFKPFGSSSPSNPASQTDMDQPSTSSSQIILLSPNLPAKKTPPMPVHLIQPLPPNMAASSIEAQHSRRPAAPMSRASQHPYSPLKSGLSDGLPRAHTGAPEDHVAIPSPSANWPEQESDQEAQADVPKKTRHHRSSADKPKMKHHPEVHGVAGSKSDRKALKVSGSEKRRRQSRDSDGSNFNPNIPDVPPRSPRPERKKTVHPRVDISMVSKLVAPYILESFSSRVAIQANGFHSNQQNSVDSLSQREPEYSPIPSTSAKHFSPAHSPSREAPVASTSSLITKTQTRTTSRTSEDAFPPSPSFIEEPPANAHVDTVRQDPDEDQPPRKKPKPQRPKPPATLNGSGPIAHADHHEGPNSTQEPVAGSSTATPNPVYRIPTIIPACEPDDFGEYESSTCHQCRIKTTRPKMICDQSQDPNCVVRVCITCLFRSVYDDHPELRPPIFEFVPGGRMLCVKCRKLCPCASCRRRRGEEEQCRRGLGSGPKGFYGLTPEQQEEALARKKKKQEAARLKKESRPPPEKKTPLVCRGEVATIRREAAAIRHSGFDDDIEQERLPHWAPLPVFPPLPPPRKKKRKRVLDNLEASRLDCKTGHSASESSCSDSDSNDDTDSDDLISISSASSNELHNRNTTALDPATFSLSLTSHPPSRSLTTLSKRWRSSANGTRAEDSSNCPEQLYRAVVKRKAKSTNKAPIVWIKGGAIVHARKPPTKEFMDKLAEEQKGRSSSGGSTLPEEDQKSPHLQESLHQCMEENPKETEMDDGHSNLHNQDSLPASLPSCPADIESERQNITNADCITLKPLTLTGDPSKSDWIITASPGGYGHLSLHAAMQRTHTLLPDPSSLIQQGNNPFNQDTSGSKRVNVPSFESQSQVGYHAGPGPASSTEETCDHPKPVHAFRSDLTTAPDQPYLAGSGPSAPTQGAVFPRALHGFDADAEPTLDHRAYLAGLTDEQLTDVLKQGNYAMANQGFLPPPLIASHHAHSNISFASHPNEYSTGISPELISASLPVASGSESATGTVETEMLGHTELTEEDQEVRLIEAASWAAVWGATDGIGGFTLTHPSAHESRATEDGQINNRSKSSLSSPGWDYDDEEVQEGTAADKELFLKAMRSSVGDEWLIDVMALDKLPLDICE